MDRRMLNKDNWKDIINILDYLADPEKELLTIDNEDKEYYQELKDKVENEYAEYCYKMLEPTADEMLAEEGYIKEDDEDNPDGIWYENSTDPDVTYYLGFMYNDHFVKQHYWIGSECYEEGYTSSYLAKAIAKKIEELDEVGWKE